MIGENHKKLLQWGLSISISATALIGIAAVTDLQLVLHRTMVFLAVVAFWPFLLIAGGLALIVVVFGVVLVIGALGDGLEVSSSFPDAGTMLGGEMIDGGLSSIGAYYGFLTRRRHPVFWGIPLGLILGCLALWAFLAITVYPKEAETIRVMADAQAHLEQAYEENKRFPTADESGRLRLSEADGPLLDGFGEPLLYTVEGRWPLARWSLRSSGSDGVVGTSTDFCLEGATTLAEAARKTQNLLQRIQKSDSSNRDALQGILELRCAPSS
ncbi:MAG: hypothetical protein ACNA8W_01655 [Bradymonadaceae bacterium]